MKKIFLTTAILLLAAACNKQQAQVQPMQNQPAQQSQALQVQPIVSTENWQLYQNSEIGFQVNYPDQWTAYEYPSNSPLLDGPGYYKIGFGPKDEAAKENFYILLDIFPNPVSLQQVSGQIEQAFGNKMADVSVNGMAAKDVVINRGNHAVYQAVFILDNRGYQLTSTGVDSNDQQAIDIAKTILSTFKVTK